MVAIKYLLTDDKSIFTYLDPPYEIGSNLYGKRGNMHKGFDHDAFATICDRFIGPQLISYNSSQLIRERFQGWTVAEFAHTYTMRSVGSYNTDQASRKELVLLTMKCEVKLYSSQAKSSRKKSMPATTKKQERLLLLVTLTLRWWESMLSSNNTWENKETMQSGICSQVYQPDKEESH